MPMKPPAVIRKSISLSKAVSLWADEMAQAKGFGTNFSAYIADLIRKDKERETQEKDPNFSNINVAEEIATAPLKKNRKLPPSRQKQ